eukprot:scaffold160217_cov30-Tisochrysis_lutea.AAC.1
MRARVARALGLVLSTAGSSNGAVLRGMGGAVRGTVRAPYIPSAEAYAGRNAAFLSCERGACELHTTAGVSAVEALHALSAAPRAGEPRMMAAPTVEQVRPRRTGLPSTLPRWSLLCLLVPGLPRMIEISA